MLMMSLFSSFDALFAESLGQKVTLSWPPADKEDKHQGGSMSVPPLVVSDHKGGTSSSVDGLEKGEKGMSSSSSYGKKPASRQPTRPRFAPELDGVHCFETIIPY